MTDSKSCTSLVQRASASSKRKQVAKYISCNKEGFTLIELLIVAAIMALMLAVGTPFLFGKKTVTDLEEEVQKMEGALGYARAKAIAAEQGSAWGVHFDNATSSPLYDLFWGSSYSVSTTTDRMYLPDGISFTAPTSSTSTDIIFLKRSGSLSSATTTTIAIQTATGGFTKSITISSNGRIMAQ